MDLTYSGAGENAVKLFSTYNWCDASKGEGKATLKFTGYFNPCYGMQGAKYKKEEEYFTKVLANTFNDAKAKDYDLRLLTPIATEVAVSFEVSNLVRKDKDYAYLSLKNPYLFNSDFDISLTRENRQTPLVFPTWNF